MKTTGFLKKDYFGFGILAQLFNLPQDKNKSESPEDLKQEISTKVYREKVKYLIRQDLLLRYTPETVEQGLEDFELVFTAEDFSQPIIVKEEELVVQKQPSQVVRKNEILTDEKKQEVWKVQNRIPKWFKNPHQINSRILIAFMDLLGENKSVPLYKLEAACKSIKTFQNNYNQMKSFGERNHAKVFEEAGGRITLWEPVRDFILREHRQFKRRNSNY